MTDNDIIKAWEKCSNPANDCYGDDYTCPYSTGDKGTGECFNKLREDVTGLINRKDAEIERLKGRVEATEISKQKLLHCFKTAKSEAIKEFAERLRTNVNKDLRLYGNCTVFDLVKHIENLVKEMTEVSK